jgi:hypothetical protein
LYEAREVEPPPLAANAEAFRTHVLNSFASAAASGIYKCETGDESVPRHAQFKRMRETEGDAFFIKNAIPPFLSNIQQTKIPTIPTFPLT